MTLGMSLLMEMTSNFELLDQHFPAIISTFQQLFSNLSALFSNFSALISTYQHISLQKVGVKDQHVTSDLISFSFCFSIRILLGGIVSMDISLSALSS